MSGLPAEADPSATAPIGLLSAVRRDAVGVGIATGAYGLSFGALAVTSGFSPLQAQVLSLALFSGASQFAAVGIVAAGGGAAAAIGTALLLGTRNGLYGLTLSGLLPLRRWSRLAAAQLTIDESTAMAVSRDEPGQRTLIGPAFWWTGASVFVFWNLATLIGAMAASQFDDPRVLGLDAAVPAAFLALLWPRLRDRTTRSVAAAAGVVALILTPVLSPGLPVLFSALIAVAVGLWPHHRGAAPSGPADGAT